MIRSNLRSMARLFIPAAKTRVVTNAQLNSLFEMAILDLCVYANALRTNTTFTVTADQSEYVFSAVVDNFLTMDKPGLWWNDGDQWQKLDAVTLPYLDKTYPNWRDDDSGDPQRYTVDLDTIVVHPAPDTTLTNGFKIYYNRNPIAMSLDTHYPFVGNVAKRPSLEIFDDAILKYVKWKLEPALSKDANIDRNRQAYLTEREEKKKLYHRRIDISNGDNRSELKGSQFQGRRSR